MVPHKVSMKPEIRSRQVRAIGTDLSHVSTLNFLLCQKCALGNSPLSYRHCRDAKKMTNCDRLQSTDLKQFSWTQIGCLKLYQRLNLVWDHCTF